MSKVAYCGGCGRYIQLTPQVECPAGHPRSELRDVREGPLPSARSNHSVATAAQAVDHSDLIAQVIGKGVVLVPLALLSAFGIWTGYYQFPGSPLMRLLMSIGSLGLTVGLAFLWYGMKRRRH
jgi:hypothetical protein